MAAVAVHNRPTLSGTSRCNSPGPQRPGERRNHNNSGGRVDRPSSFLQFDPATTLRRWRKAMKMKHRYLRSLFVTVGVAAIVATAAAQRPSPAVRLGYGGQQQRPDAAARGEKLQQLQPALGERGRAGGHPGAQPGRAAAGATDPRHLHPRHGCGRSPIVRILDRTTLVPYPNNLGTTFVETPSFPRIDIDSDTIATRGNHQPVWTISSRTTSDRDPGRDHGDLHQPLR